MNALPVGLEQIADPAIRADYFSNLEHRGFDVAVTAFCGDNYYSATERFRQAYIDFALEARKLGYAACVKIPASVCSTDQLAIEEAQFDLSNEPTKAGPKVFYPSPASDAWKAHLKELITFFLRDSGYDWVIIEEPAYRVDVPGKKDRICGRFAAMYPDAKCPTSPDETPEYLQLQQTKAEAVLEFCLELAAHCKELGAKRVGLIPQVFLPSAQEKADRIPHTTSDQGSFILSENVDFLVSAVGVDNAYSGELIADGGPTKSPELCYAEVMIQSAGKPVMAPMSPIIDAKKKQSLPLDFYRDTLLAALAAGSSGFIGPDFGCDSPDDEYSSLLGEAGVYAGRLGHPYTALAFVFSESGGRHAAPNDYATVFGHYWAFAKQMANHAHVPFLTFHAETLQGSLAEHPEVRVLVFEEHFPLTIDQMLVIRDWWEGPEKRAIVAFGSGLGLSADPNLPGSRPCAHSLPGVLELIGLKQDLDQPVFTIDKPMALRDVSRVRRSALFGDNPPRTLSKVANVRRVFGSRASVLYELDMDDPKIPVISEWKDRTTLAIFCGFGLDAQTAEAAEAAVRYALKETDNLPVMLTDCSDGLLWNMNKHGYIIISNLSDKPATAVGKPGRSMFWDCKLQKMLPEGDVTFTVEPHSFDVYRVVGRRSKFFDIRGISYLRSLVDGAGKADIEILAGKTTTLVLRASPKDITVDGKASTITQEVINGAYHVTLQHCPPGERKIGLKW